MKTVSNATIESIRTINGLIQKAQVTASESARKEFLRDAIGRMDTIIPALETTMVNPTVDQCQTRGIHMNRQNMPYTQWICIIVALCCEVADLSPDCIALTEPDLKTFYAKDMTPAQVVFDAWELDAGNFFNM